jgi:hypothetical protein
VKIWSLIEKNAKVYQCELMIFCSLFLYILPQLLGFGWSAVGAYNSLNPPENYLSRGADSRITVEAWGASVVTVPSQIKSRFITSDGEWPFWNPYQGLGQPLAAMGEGNPYYPPSLLRSIFPYSWMNLFLVLNVFVSQLFLFKFLLRMGLSRSASAFGAIAFGLSGAISFHLARANMLEQICIIPILFWAVIYSFQRNTLGSYGILAITTALNASAGFIQVAMLSQIGALAYGGFLILLLDGSLKQKFNKACLFIGAIIIGLGISSYYLLPLVNWLFEGVGKNYPFLGFLNLPKANGIAFFFPLLFGQWFSTQWMPAVPGSFSFPEWVVHWDNLYAIAGTSLLFASIAPLWGTKWTTSSIKRSYVFFFIGAALLLLRYINIAPASIINFLPIIGRQSPKHANALMVFFFVVAASIAVDQIKNLSLQKVKITFLIAFIYLFTLTAGLFGIYLFSIYETGNLLPTNLLNRAALFIGITLLILILTIVTFYYSHQLAVRDIKKAHQLLIILVIAELLLYVPLGNIELWFVCTRIFLSCYILLLGYISVGLIEMPRRYFLPAQILIPILFSSLIYFPQFGLPKLHDLTKPPKFMEWIASDSKMNFRSFGIFPDSSVAAKIQDIGVVGPLAPTGYLDFIKLSAPKKTFEEYQKTGHLLLEGPWKFDLNQIELTKPVFDWVGIKYFVLEKNPETDTKLNILLKQASSSIGYSDERVNVVMSASARPKVEFWSTCYKALNKDGILSMLSTNPDLILGAPFVEDELTSIKCKTYDGKSTLFENQQHVAKVSHQSLNSITVILQENISPGILLLKDVYSPGWQVKVDGDVKKVLRINGFVKGVEITNPKAKKVVFTYVPPFFMVGVLISTISIIFFLIFAVLNFLNVFTNRRKLSKVIT